MEVIVNKTRLFLLQGDITRQTTDAIVNAANSSLMGGGGVDGAIHRAGGPAILEECKQIVFRQGRLPAGKAVITTGGNLKARYVIHTVGPIWRDGTRGESELLASAYRESLRAAVAKGLKAISFPSISTGAYGYPVDQAAEVALRTVIDFLHQEASLNTVAFVLFDARTYQVYARTLERLMSEVSRAK
jgi:O-acetyl-ADP-ribose deacetylase (regulator of RNase III)